MGISLSDEEKKQLAKNAFRGGWSVTRLENADEQPWSFYHDLKTGKEVRLPSDPFSIQHYRMKGLKLGRLPGNYEIAEQTEENKLPDNVQEIVNAAVKAALQAAGVVQPAENKEVLVEQPKAPVQLKLL